MRRKLSLEGRIYACQIVKKQGTHDRQREKYVQMHRKVRELDRANYNYFYVAER